MTGSDGGYRQNAGQPQSNAGRQGEHPGQGHSASGQPSPSGNQYRSGSQNPAAGQYSGGGQPASGGHSSTANQYSEAGQQHPAGSQQYPAAEQPYPAVGQQYPAEQYPAAGPYSAGGQYAGAATESGQGYAGQGYAGQGYAGQGYAGQGYAGQGYAGQGYAAGRGWEAPPGAQDPRAAGSSAVRPRAGIDPAKLFGLAVAVLGGLNFVWGFLPEVSAPRSGETLSVFAVGPAYVPILLLIAGLLALAAFLPGSERSRLAVAAVSVGGAAGAIVSLGTPGSFELFANPGQVSSGLGAILLVIFGIIQAVIAVGAYVVGADTLWTRKKGAGQAGQAAPPVPGSRSWDAGHSAPGGPVHSNLVGVVPQPHADDAGASYRGGPDWPAEPRAARPHWYNPGSVSGYPQPSAYGPPAEPTPPASATSVLPPRPPRHEEPVTGPQMVVGMETVRVDIGKQPGAVPPSSGIGGGAQAAGPAVPTRNAVGPAGEPEDREQDRRIPDSTSAADRPSEQDPPHRPGS